MSETILVVDDDPATRNSLAKLLRVDGFRVVTAETGQGALDAVQRVGPDLVLLDVVMHDLDGFEVCRRLKSDPETRLIPVVLLTGLSEVDDRVRGLEAGADDFLTKPPERAELMARVRSLLRVKRYTDELERAEVVLMALARSIEARDPYTDGHCERLSLLAARLGERLGVSEELITALRRGGTVHDIGKVAVPDEILLKNEPLSDEEWEVLKQHPVVGEHICRPLKSFRLVLPIIRHHHEKGDGSGYPDGLEGEQVPLTARILQVVDVYDALTTRRPYKPALPPGEALETMREEVDRGWWDRRVFAEFRRMMGDGRGRAAGDR